MLIRAVVPGLLLAVSAAAEGETDCGVLFETLRGEIESVYAGYPIEVVPSAERASAYEVAVASARDLAEDAASRTD